MKLIPMKELGIPELMMMLMARQIVDIAPELKADISQSHQQINSLIFAIRWL